MKKIMFNDKYGLTAAVLAGTKTQTRRIIPQSIVNELYYAGFYGDFTDNLKQILIKKKSRYNLCEKVAVAQNYNEVYSYYRQHNDNVCAVMIGRFGQFHKGWANKMFVEAMFMPYKIEITGIRVQRLQDISEQDCLAEGIAKEQVRLEYDEPYDTILYDFPNSKLIKKSTNSLVGYYLTAKEAYAALIDQISGKGTWMRNPWVFAYTFSLSNSDSNKEV